MTTEDAQGKSGLFWFKGKVRHHDGKFYDAEPTVVLVDEGYVYFPGGSSGGVRLNETIGHWMGPLEIPKEL